MTRHREPGGGAGVDRAMLIVMSAVLAGDAGAFTGLTMALRCKLRSMNTDSDQRRAPDNSEPAQRVRMWPVMHGDRMRLPRAYRQRGHLSAVGTAVPFESQPKVIEPPAPSLADVTERLVTVFRAQVPLITIIATARHTRRDLGWITGNSFPAAVEQVARDSLTELTRQAPR